MSTKINLGSFESSSDFYQELTTLNESISLEARDTNFIFSRVKDTFPSFYSKATAFIATVFKKDIPNDFTQFNINKISKYLRKAPYQDIRSEMVIVPLGLKADYLTYMNALSKFQDDLDLLMDDVLVPFERMLALILSDTSAIASHRDIGRKAMDKISKRSIKDRTAILSSMFDKKNNEFATYGSVISRNNDWANIVINMNFLTDRYARLNLSDIQEMVGTISSHLNILIGLLNEDPETYKPSGISIKSLTDVTYNLAKEIEYLAVHGYQLEYLETSIEDAVRVLKEHKA